MCCIDWQLLSPVNGVFALDDSVSHVLYMNMKYQDILGYAEVYMCALLARAL